MNEDMKLSTMAKEVISIAEQTGEILMASFRSEFSTDFKNKDAFDPVTSVDLAADTLVRNLLIEKFPDDLILSEENTDIPTDYSKRVWMVDPLDGTKDYVKGKDGFGIHIGLLENNEILFGLVFSPARKRLFYAEKGVGAFERKGDSFEKIHVSQTTSLVDARLITRSPGKDKRPLDEIVDQFPAKEKIHDSGIKVSRIACGEIDAHLNTNFRISKWDTLAPQIILEEAGGVLTDIDGNPLNYQQDGLRWDRSYVAANSQEMLDQILEIVKQEEKV